MGQTVVEKIAQKHMTSGPEGRPVRAGDFLTIRPRHVMTHDNTSAVMKKFRSIGVKRVHDPRQPVFILDHDGDQFEMHCLSSLQVDSSVTSVGRARGASATR